ncbi:protein kinase activating protein dpb11 [Dipsacomyces acuminosporus]|nr:protein kinase activating protein dpb11 [Dipsacomyces acuminosporus]
MSSTLNSKKYQVSAKVGIPVVSLGFIAECEREAWKRSKAHRRSQLVDSSDVEGDGNDSVSATVKKITERSRLPPFSGCRICITGFNDTIRDEIRHLVTHSIGEDDGLYAKYSTDAESEGSASGLGQIGGGGSFYGELTQERTHLIAFRPAGTKYDFAKRWGLCVVSFEWFLQSLRTGFRQEESKYTVESIEDMRHGVNAGAGAGAGARSGYNQKTENAGSALLQKPASGSPAELVIPQTRASFTNQDGSIPSRAASRNHTAAGSLNTDSFDLPPGLTGPLVVDEDYADGDTDSSRNVLPIPAASRTSANETIDEDAGSLPTPKRSSPLSSPSSTIEPMFDSCRIALSEASLSMARRKEWRAKIAEAGGIWIAEGALGQHIRYLAAHSTQGSRPSFCTHYVVDDSDELCGDDLEVLQSLEGAAAPQQLLSCTGSTERSSLSASSLPQVERPLIIQVGWLRACWRAKKRADELPYLIPWPEAASNTIPTSSSKSHASISESATAAREKPQPQHLSRRSATSDGPPNSMLPPQPRLSSFSRALATGVSLAGSKRQHSSGSMVGKPIGNSGIGTNEPDPFMEQAQARHGQAVGSDDGQEYVLLKRKKQRTSLSHDLRRQNTNPGGLGTFGSSSEVGNATRRRKTSCAAGVDSLSSEHVNPGQAGDFTSSPLQLELSALTNRSLQLQRNPSASSHEGGQLQTAEELSRLRDSEMHQPRISEANSTSHAGTDPPLPNDSSLFAGCKFTSLGFSSKAVNTLNKVVCDKGGSYIDILSCLPAPLAAQQGAQALRSEASLKSALTALACFVDGKIVTDVYLVIQLQGYDELPWCESATSQHKYMHIVTECWVELCLQSNVRYPDYGIASAQPSPLKGLSAGQHVLFKPVQTKAVEGADKLSLSVSGYEGTERDHIGKLAMALNIPYSERFSRKTTHLICQRPFKGPKHERAVKWGIPVVESQWIYNIAISGTIGDISLPPDADAKTDGNPDAHKAIKLQIAGTAASAGPDAADSHAQIIPPPSATPAIGTVNAPRTASKGKHAADSASSRPIVTPLTKFTQHQTFAGTPGLTPIDACLERNLQQALGNNNSRAASPRDDDATQMTPTRAPQHDSCSSGGCNCSEDSGGLKRVLSGSVVVLTTRLSHRRNELAGLAAMLGCRVLPRFDAKQTTHLIHQSSRERETLRDYRVAVQSGISVVSPWWLYACHDSQMRVPESEFPYTYQPERRLRLVSTSPAKPLVVPQQPKTAETAAAAAGAASSRHPLAEAGMQLLSHSLKNAQITSAHTTGIDLQSSHRAAAEHQASHMPLVSTSTIDSLFGKKVAGTRRKYRQASNESTAQPSTKASAPQSKRLGQLHTLAAANQPAADRVGHDGPVSADRSQPSVHASESSALAASLVGKDQNAMQTPEKWWLNVEPPSSARYGSGYATNLYSQEFQFSSGKGTDLTGGSFGGGSSSVFKALNDTPSAMSRRSTGNQYDEAPPQPAAQSKDQTSSDTAVAATKERGEVGNQQEALPFSSPLGTHRTTIIYGEDAQALSERDQLLERLNGK